MQSNLPRIKSQWFVVVSAFIYVAIVAYLEIFLDIDLITANDSMLFHHWLLRLIRDVSLVVCIFGTLILSIRSLRREGFSLRRLVAPTIATLFCIFLAGVSIYSYITMSDIQQKLFYYDNNFTKSLKKSLDEKTIPSSQRSEISLMYAKQVWRETGETISYFTADGNEVVYKPSVEEIETKQKMNRTNELITSSLKGLKIAYILWPLVAAVGIIVGFFTPLKKENEIIN